MAAVVVAANHIQASKTCPATKLGTDGKARSLLEHSADACLHRLGDVGKSRHVTVPVPKRRPVGVLDSLADGVPNVLQRNLGQVAAEKLLIYLEASISVDWLVVSLSGFISALRAK
jgi:hypothetical protein